MCAHVQNQRIARASERAEKVGFNSLDFCHGEDEKNPRNECENRMQINAAQYI